LFRPWGIGWGPVDYGLVAQGEADLAGKLAVQVRQEVEDWIRKNHADKIT